MKEGIWKNDFPNICFSRRETESETERQEEIEGRGGGEMVYHEWTDETFRLF